MRPATTQISLGICLVWSESSLCAQWEAKDPSFLHANSEDSDQTGRMARLIWVFAGRTCHFVGFVVLRPRWRGYFFKCSLCARTHRHSVKYPTFLFYLLTIYLKRRLLTILSINCNHITVAVNVCVLGLCYDNPIRGISQANQPRLSVEIFSGPRNIWNDILSVKRQIIYRFTDLPVCETTDWHFQKSCFRTWLYTRQKPHFSSLWKLSASLSVLVNIIFDGAIIAKVRLRAYHHWKVLSRLTFCLASWIVWFTTSWLLLTNHNY